MAILAILAVLLWGFLGIGSASSGAGAAAAPSVATVAAEPLVTQADSGRSLRVDPGQAVDLRLSSRWTWSTPRVSGKGSALVQRDRSVTGSDAYVVQPSGTGTVTITATGRPGPRRFKLTIHVG